MTSDSDKEHKLSRGNRGIEQADVPAVGADGDVDEQRLGRDVQVQTIGHVSGEERIAARLRNPTYIRFTGFAPIDRPVRLELRLWRFRVRFHARILSATTDGTQ